MCVCVNFVVIRTGHETERQEETTLILPAPPTITYVFPTPRDQLPRSPVPHPFWQAVDKKCKCDKTSNKYWKGTNYSTVCMHIYACTIHCTYIIECIALYMIICVYSISFMWNLFSDWKVFEKISGEILTPQKIFDRSACHRITKKNKAWSSMTL